MVGRPGVYGPAAVVHVGQAYNSEFDPVLTRIRNYVKGRLWREDCVHINVLVRVWS